ncbi:MAG: ATP-binding cassette domain-containing protein [Breznakia sp.]
MKLKIDDLSMEFDQKVVLKGIDYTFESGKIYALLGRNGAGKTTFFNCISSDLKATTMHISLDDGNTIRKRLRQEDVGYVISTPVVPDFLTGREFLKFLLDIHKLEVSKEYIDEQFNFLNIDVADRDVLMKNYSHGMKSKMQILANIITNPAILLLDEPLTSFDIVMAEQMKQLLKGIKKEHIIIFSTHIMELALDLCDEILVLSKGYLQAVSRSGKTLEDVKNEVIRLLSEDDYV